MTAGRTAEFDPIWERIYRDGHANLYPWDCVVTFVHRHRPRDKERGDTAILEMWCGSAPNLWFAAREGFRVAGIDASETAIAKARERFAAEGLAGDLRVGNFNTLPWPDDSFDLVIDRAAVTCVGRSVAAQAYAEAHRVLRPGGALFCNVYSDRHASRASGQRGDDGVTVDIAGGTLVGVGQVCFYDLDQLCAQFPDSLWTVLSCEHVLAETVIGETQQAHAEWRLIAKKHARQ